jgi:hypothetical protein
VPNHSLKDFGIINGRIIHRVDLDGGPVLPFLVIHLFDELREAVDRQARTTGVQSIRFDVVIPLLARVEFSVLLRLKTNLSPCGAANVEPLFCESLDPVPSAAVIGGRRVGASGTTGR